MKENLDLVAAWYNRAYKKEDIRGLEAPGNGAECNGGETEHV
jgi:hypothetical protein